MGYTTIVVEVASVNDPMIEKIRVLLDQLGLGCACQCTTVRFYQPSTETTPPIQCVKFAVMSAWDQEQINQTLEIIQTTAYYEANQKRNKSL